VRARSQPPKLSSDYEKLYKSGKYTDISIHVGPQHHHRNNDNDNGGDEGQHHGLKTQCISNLLLGKILNVKLSFLCVGKVQALTTSNARNENADPFKKAQLGRK